MLQKIMLNSEGVKMARTKFDEWLIKIGKRFGQEPMPELPEKRKLTKKEAEWMADYFHNKEYAPDFDGYLGHYSLPKEVMVIKEFKNYKGE